MGALMNVARYCGRDMPLENRLPAREIFKVIAVEVKRHGVGDLTTIDFDEVPEEVSP